MEQQRILTAQEAAEVRVTKHLKLEDVMFNIQLASNNGRGSVTYDVRYEAIEDGVISKLKELGYDIQFTDYKTSAWLTIMWESDAQRQQRIQQNMPKDLVP